MDGNFNQVDSVITVYKLVQRQYHRPIPAGRILTVCLSLIIVK